MAPTAPHLQFRNVDVSYGRKKVLDGLNLLVAKQERLVVMGSSGSGKSTLLRLVLATLRPQAGFIEFGGDEITHLTTTELNRIRKKMGMVYQNGALVSSLTVEDNLRLPLRELSTKSLVEMDKIVDEKLELVGMRDTKKLLPAELSGGMRKRVSFARALVLDPELLLFDEPSGGLDPVNRLLIDELMIGLTNQFKSTSIVVTHEISSAMRVATSIAMLHNGKIVEQDTPTNFKKSVNPVVREFLAAEVPNLQSQKREHGTSTP